MAIQVSASLIFSIQIKLLLSGEHDYGITGSFDDTLELGDTLIPGSATHDNCAYTVQSVGSGMNSSSDGFYFIYKSWAENGTVTARIDALDGAGDSARAGIMARADSSARSPFTFLGPDEDGNLAFIRRTHGGEQRVEITVAEVNVPLWVRLNRYDDHVKAEYSLNGFTRHRVGRQTIDLSDTSRTGLAASSQMNKEEMPGHLRQRVFCRSRAGITSPVRPHSKRPGDGPDFGKRLHQRRLCGRHHF